MSKQSEFEIRSSHKTTSDTHEIIHFRYKEACIKYSGTAHSTYLRVLWWVSTSILYVVRRLRQCSDILLLSAAALSRLSCIQLPVYYNDRFGRWIWIPTLKGFTFEVTLDKRGKLDTKVSALAMPSVEAQGNHIYKLWYYLQYDPMVVRYTYCSPLFPYVVHTYSAVSLQSRIRNLTGEVVAVATFVKVHSVPIDRDTSLVRGARAWLHSPATEPAVLDRDNLTLRIDIDGARRAFESDVEVIFCSSQGLQLCHAFITRRNGRLGAMISQPASVRQLLRQTVLLDLFVGDLVWSQCVAGRQTESVAVDLRWVGLCGVGGFPYSAWVAACVLPPDDAGRQPSAAGGTLHPTQTAVDSQRWAPRHGAPLEPSCASLLCRRRQQQQQQQQQQQ